VPSKGDVTIDGVPLRNVLREWRSHVGYVPQDVTLFNGTVAQNVALTWNDDIDDAKVTAALKRAQLWPAIKRRPGGLYSEVGDRGLALSGGQRQRLGIARALYNNPLILVMDEATSALDTRTEADVADALNSLAGEVTIISVAHRLSTIRECDQIVYMQDGEVRDQGTFEQIVKRVPEFREQARLAGLA
jgi:ATP-binding cassette subfamily C protein